jgi:hypothetical protein
VNNGGEYIIDCFIIFVTNYLEALKNRTNVCTNPICCGSLVLYPMSGKNHLYFQYVKKAIEPDALTRGTILHNSCYEMYVKILSKRINKTAEHILTEE